MPLRKCPKCDLNYLRGDEKICRVCAAEMDKKHRRESDPDEVIMCTECGERPAVPGKELCEECLKEQKRQADLELHADKVRADEADDPIEEDFSGMDEENSED